MLSNLIYKNNNKTKNLCCILLSFLPIIFFIGNGAGNTLVIIIDTLFLYILIKNKQLNFLNNYLFYLLIIFWVILLGNLIFSINFENSLGRSIGFIRFVFLVFAIKFFFQFEKNIYKDLILKFWSFFLLIISFDIIFEVIFGFNTLGFSTNMPGRLSSFFDQELKIGNLYSSFYLIILSFILYLKSSNSKFSKKIFKNYNFNYLFFFILFFILISFLIGERSNLIRVIIMSILFLFIMSKNWINILKFLITSILVTTIFLMSSKNYHWRYWDAFLEPLISNPLQAINKSHYGSHYKTAIQVFNNHKLYGVGLKNYRLEVQKEEYPDLSSIHPHQIHFEVLAELGSIGYLYFIFFMFVSVLKSINSYRYKKDYFVLSGMLYVITILLPILPSGSFFTSFGATVFWVNYALMTSNIPRDLK
tara:strand:+ start:2633 stop:3889 length:1257 start_codon:yes stop_codon:yes gene_type:complete